MDAQLKAQLRQCIAFKVSAATANDYGEITVGSTATVMCRQELRTRMIEREFGAFIATRSPLVVLDENVATPTFENIYWLPGTSPATASLGRRAKFIEHCVDEFGRTDHWEIEF